MHDYLEKVVEVLGAMRVTALSLSDILRALFIGLVILALAFVTIDVVWLRNKREKKRMLVKALYRVEATDDLRKGERKTIIDVLRIRFPLDDPPAKRNAVEDQTETTDETVESKYDERKASVDKRDLPPSNRSDKQ